MKASRIIMTCLIALSLGFGTSAYAGGGKHKHKDRANWEQMSEQEKLEHHQKRLDRRVGRLAEKLELTDAQKVKVRQILESAQTEKMDIKARHQGDREAARAEFKEAKQAQRAEIAKVLTAEQQEQLKSLKKDKRDKRGKKMERKKQRGK